MKPVREGKAHMNALLIIAVIAGWLVLQLWVLPKFGIST
jgi:hypothetical protein